MSQKYKHMTEELLKLADVEINGSRPWDIQVHDERLYARVFNNVGLGLGESYMDGWWDVEALDEFFNRITKAQLREKVEINITALPLYLKALGIYTVLSVK